MFFTGEKYFIMGNQSVYFGKFPSGLCLGSVGRRFSLSFLLRGMK
jgi:hypothetical protein